MEQGILQKRRLGLLEKYETWFWIMSFLATVILLIVGIWLQLSPICPQNVNCGNETQTSVWTILLLIIPFIMQVFVGYHGYIKRESLKGGACKTDCVTACFTNKELVAPQTQWRSGSMLVSSFESASSIFLPPLGLPRKRLSRLIDPLGISSFFSSLF